MTARADSRLIALAKPVLDEVRRQMDQLLEGPPRQYYHHYFGYMVEWPSHAHRFSYQEIRQLLEVLAAEYRKKKRYRSMWVPDIGQTQHYVLYLPVIR